MALSASAKNLSMRWVRALTLLSLVTPLVVIIAVFGTRLGVWSLAFGFEVLTLRAGQALAWLGAGAGLLALVVGFRSRAKAWPLIGVALVSGLVTLGLFQIQVRSYQQEGGVDVTTDPADPPGFSRAIMNERRGVETMPVACDGLDSMPRQIAPETASTAMRRAGFIALGSAAFRADGYRESFWFGQVHHVAIRIRPGQTDVRVAARYPVRAGQEACDLARDVVAGLQPRPG